MNIKLFGKQIFEYSSSRSAMIFQSASDSSKKSKYLTDFYKLSGANRNSMNPLSEYVVMTDSDIESLKAQAPKKKVKKVKKEINLTPKGVYTLELLNDKTFKIKTDEKYVSEQIEDFKEKLNLLSAEEYDMENGVMEVSSVLSRLENRTKYSKHSKFYTQFAYTNSTKISEILDNHKNLQIGQVAQFVADMPKEAVTIMKDYNKETKSLCGKQAVFYIIADKKDFKKNNERRDPILLAQSPFGHFWQILGAWDEEMLFLEEL